MTVDLSGHLSRSPTWEEFRAALRESGDPGTVLVTPNQGAALAFDKRCKVTGPGRFVTPHCTVETQEYGEG
jgi:hypothetical protein